MKTMMIKYLTIIIFLLYFGSPFSQSSYWEHLDGPYGLYLSSIVIDSNNKLFVGGSTGIFSSTDDGYNWIKCNTNKYITSLIVTPAGKIMANAKDNGINLSSDSGKSWMNISKEEKKFAFCDSMGNVYAFSEYDSYKLYRSSNNGNSWEPILIGSSKNGIISGMTNKNGLIYLMSTEGTFKSSDGGLRWANVSEQKLDNNGILSSFQDTLWYCSPNKLFKSIDGAKTWYKVESNKPNGWLNKFIITASGEMYVLLQIYEYSRDVLLISKNNGKTWDICFENNSQITAIVLNTRNEIFVTSIDVFKSINDGHAWIRASRGLTNDNIPLLLINNQGVVFAGTSWYLFRSNDEGKHWKQIDTSFQFKGPNPYKQIVATDDSTIFLITSADNIFYESTNLGDTWFLSSLGTLASIMKQKGEKTVQPFFPASGGTYDFLDQGKVYGIYNSFQDKYVVNDQGYILSSILQDPRTGESEAYINKINEDGSKQVIINDQSNFIAILSKGNNLFIKDKFENLYYSDNNGTSWNLSDLVADNILNIIETNDGRLFTAKMFDGIFYSENGGKNWKKINENVKVPYIDSIELHPNGHLFVGTRFGLFRSKIIIDEIK